MIHFRDCSPYRVLFTHLPRAVATAARPVIGTSVIWLLIAQRLPDCHFLIAGLDTPDRIRQLQSDRLQTLDYVADLSDLFERVKLSVAPLRFGAGLKGKAISSFRYGVPVIGTPIAFEGIHLSRSYTAWWIANCPEVFASCVTKAYSNAALWLEASNRGLDCVHEHFSMDTVAPKMRAVLTELLQLRHGEVKSSKSAKSAETGPR